MKKISPSFPENFKLSRDTYLLVAKFADDKTILNMLSVNKKFNDPKFFQQVMEYKYPLLIKYKKPEETWKKFFLNMVYCISKIEETHDIPYYPVERYNPKLYCNSSKLDILNNIMALAAKHGQKDIVELMIQKGATDFDWAMAFAAENGHKDIVKLMIQKGATNFKISMASAARYGHKDIVELMIQKGATDFNRAMTYAALGSHKDIVELMIQKGATDFNGAMIYAALGGHKDIVELMIQNGATDIKWAMTEAEENGHKDIVEYLKSL